MPHWQMQSVRMSARVGSPRFDETANGLKNGITSSLAIAWSNRGAPVKLCKPAPNVDKNDPINITHSFGHAILATTSFPPIDAPNLKKNKNVFDFIFLISIELAEQRKQYFGDNCIVWHTYHEATDCQQCQRKVGRKINKLC